MAAPGPVTPAQAQAQALVVTVPAEIDMANADDLAGQLAATLAPGVPAVIADMTATRFCDSTGIAMLLRARKRAMANGTNLRVLPSPAVLQVMHVLGVDAVLPTFHSLDEALAGKARQ